MVLSDTNTKHNTKSTRRSFGCRALWRRRRRLAKPLPGEGSPVEPSRPFNRAGKRGSFRVAPTSALIPVAFPDSMLSTSPGMAPTGNGLVPADALSSTCSQPRTHGRERTLPPPTPHAHEQANLKYAQAAIAAGCGEVHRVVGALSPPSEVYFSIPVPRSCPASAGRSHCACVS